MKGIVLFDTFKLVFEGCGSLTILVFRMDVSNGTGTRTKDNYVKLCCAVWTVLSIRFIVNYINKYLVNRM